MKAEEKLTLRQDKKDKKQVIQLGIKIDLKFWLFADFRRMVEKIGIVRENTMKKRERKESKAGPIPFNFFLP